MGQCAPPKQRNRRDPKRILSLVRHMRPGHQSLSNARMISHIDLWQEYTTGDPREVLGVGINGPVYRIFSKRFSGLSYALKEIRTKASSKKGPSESILVGLVLNELEVCLQLDHFHIARVFEVYESPHSVFLVTELCTGGELYAKLKEVSRFNEIETIFLISQILKAVNYMHNLGIVHGDLKLENFLFYSPLAGGSIFKSALKLTDFGFSHLGVQRPEGLVCGSPQYMAPEKFEVGTCESTKADMWSVGIITFMCLTGKAPFTGSTMKEMQQYFQGNANVKSTVGKILHKCSVSEDGIDFILRLLDKDVDARMSAKDALAHRWMAGMELRRTNSRIKVVSEMKKCCDLLCDFSNIGPLRRACFGLISMYGPPLMTMLSAPLLFDAVDTNNDGFIQLSELEDLFAGNGRTAEEARKVFLTADLVGDGRINFSEFIAATDVFLTTVNHPAADGLPRAYRAIIESVFSRLDVDNSGFISEENLYDLFGRKGYQGVRNADLIQEGDFRGDGSISLEEFIQLVHRGH